MKTIFFNNTLLLFIAIILTTYADTQAQTFTDTGNLQANRLRIQGDRKSENGYQRGLVSQYIHFDTGINKWAVGDGDYNDFAMMKFNNNGSINFYTRESIGGSYTLTNYALENTYKRMTILNDGNVGIGTDMPDYKLHVAGSIYSSWVRTAGNSGLYFQKYGGGFRMVDNNWIRTFGDKGFYHNKGIMRTDGTFQVGPKGNRFVVKGENVGIGVEEPANKLDVNGTVRAKEIIVEEGWGDYVFYDDYQLPTLKEEEKHIGENGHLLGFESEEDMAGEIQLGDVSKRQQVKIEEMMLHLIEMKKEIKQLKEDNKQLKKQVAEK